MIPHVIVSRDPELDHARNCLNLKRIAASSRGGEPKGKQAPRRISRGPAIRLMDSALEPP
jgi:hypothetical protein